MRIVHPNKDEFPITTRILWHYQDQGPDKDSTIKEYWPDLRKVTLVSHEGQEDVTVEVADVFIKAILGPIGSEIAYVNPNLHPIDTRLLVSYTSLPPNAPERDVTVKAWNEDGTKVKLQVNVPNGVLAWHDRENILVHKIIETTSTVVIDNPSIVINRIDHPFGTQLKIKTADNFSFDVIVRDWCDDDAVVFASVNDPNGSNPWTINVEDVTIVSIVNKLDASQPTKPIDSSMFNLFEPSPSKAQIHDEFLQLVSETKMVGEKLGYTVIVSF